MTDDIKALLSSICDKMGMCGLSSIYMKLRFKYSVPIPRKIDYNSCSDLIEVYNVNKYYHHNGSNMYIDINLIKLLWLYVFDLQSMIYHKADEFRAYQQAKQLENQRSRERAQYFGDCWEYEWNYHKSRDALR